jgi:hypothetical protein
MSMSIAEGQAIRASALRTLPLTDRRLLPEFEGTRWSFNLHDCPTGDDWLLRSSSMF